MSTEKSVFSKSLDEVTSCANEVVGKVMFSVRDKNQLYIVLPTGILPDTKKVDPSIPYLRFTMEGQKSVMLTRMAFMGDENILSDFLRKLIRYRIEFEPCMVIIKNSDGRAIVKQMGQVATAVGETVSSAPANADAGITDIGILLEGIRQTRDSISAIENLLDAPDALLTNDEDDRLALRNRVVATKDQTLIELESLGEVISNFTGQPTDEWRQNVHTALAATVESIVSFSDLSPSLKAAKCKEMETLRQSIEGYLSHLDPVEDAEECNKFSSCFNKIILEDRKNTLDARLLKLEAKSEESNDAMISAIEGMVGNSSAMPMIPYPLASPANGCEAVLTLNMIHVVMAVRYGGLSIRLDLTNAPKLYRDLQGWDDRNPPQLHIVDRKRFVRLFSDVLAQHKARAAPSPSITPIVDTPSLDSKSSEDFYVIG